MLHILLAETALDPIAVGAVAAAAALILREFGALIRDRSQGRRAEQADMMGDLKREISRLRRRLTAAEADLRLCHETHQRTAEIVARLTERLESHEAAPIPPKAPLP